MRVRAAADLGPRTSITGAPLPAIFAVVAAAQAAGDISAAHARVITATVDALPTQIRTRHGDEMQRFLLDHAAHLDPAELGKAATRLRDTLDPDGTLAEETERVRHRQLTLRTRADRTSELHAELTAACAATWQTILGALAAPTPAVDGECDLRSPGQRRHDALLDAGQRLLRSGTLPAAGGAPVTILARIDADQLSTQLGHASTATGQLLGLPELLRLADQADVVPVYLRTHGGILGYGRTRRCATPVQRRALTARDGGCSFPGCTIPADWCQAHHVIAWIDGGRTDLANLTLVCGVHHREHDRRGWACQMSNGVPHWIPPSWLDPDRTSRRNTTHHLTDLFGVRPETTALVERNPNPSAASGQPSGSRCA